MSTYQRQAIEEALSGLDLCVGSCQRILSSGLPTEYNRHTQLFVLLFITLAPIPLWDYLDWLSAALAVFEQWLSCGSHRRKATADRRSPAPPPPQGGHPIGGHPGIHAGWN